MRSENKTEQQFGEWRMGNGVRGWGRLAEFRGGRYV
jgi:hypothetical protein